MKLLPRQSILKSRKQIFKAIAWVTGVVVIFMLFSICGISCLKPTLKRWVADGVIAADEYTGQTNYGDYEIHWRSDEQYFSIGMKARTSGWVAVGFQPGPLHRETDMVLGFVSERRASVFDMFSANELGPCTADSELGGSQDVLEYGGREEGGYTTIEFRRLLSTGDEYDGELFSGSNEIMWAYSLLDDPRQKHIHRGRGEIGL